MASSISAAFAERSRTLAMPDFARSRSSRAMTGGSALLRKCSPRSSRDIKPSADQAGVAISATAAFGAGASGCLRATGDLFLGTAWRRRLLRFARGALSLWRLLGLSEARARGGCGDAFCGCGHPRRIDAAQQVGAAAMLISGRSGVRCCKMRHIGAADERTHRDGFVIRAADAFRFDGETPRQVSAADGADTDFRCRLACERLRGGLLFDWLVRCRRWRGRWIVIG